MIIVGLLALDLGVFHAKQTKISLFDSLALSAFYIIMALLFAGAIYFLRGAFAASAYLNAYLVEKTLSLDNLFVMALIFSALAIPQRWHHRVLYWGILGVIILRALLIGAGAALIARFEITLYLFSLFLVGTGIKMLVSNKNASPLSEAPWFLLLRRVVRVTPTLHGGRFFVRVAEPKPRRTATPLFLALVMIECADVLFALDSVPAALAITNDPFLVYTSNIFAILGLRALYFSTASMVQRFDGLKPAMALLLIFIGAKQFLADALGLSKFPQGLSLLITVVLLAGGVLYSLILPKRNH